MKRIVDLERVELIVLNMAAFGKVGILVNCDQIKFIYFDPNI